MYLWKQPQRNSSEEQGWFLCFQLSPIRWAFLWGEEKALKLEKNPLGVFRVQMRGGYHGEEFYSVGEFTGQLYPIKISFVPHWAGVARLFHLWLMAALGSAKWKSLSLWVWLLIINEKKNLRNGLRFCVKHFWHLYAKQSSNCEPPFIKWHEAIEENLIGCTGIDRFTWVGAASYQKKAVGWWRHHSVWTTGWQQRIIPQACTGKHGYATAHLVQSASVVTWAATVILHVLWYMPLYNAIGTDKGSHYKVDLRLAGLIET